MRVVISIQFVHNLCIYIIVLDREKQCKHTVSTHRQTHSTRCDVFRCSFNLRLSLRLSCIPIVDVVDIFVCVFVPSPPPPSVPSVTHKALRHAHKHTPSTPHHPLPISVIVVLVVLVVAVVVFVVVACHHQYQRANVSHTHRQYVGAAIGLLRFSSVS